MMADTIQARILDFVDQTVAPQFGDESAGAVNAPFSLGRIFGL